MTFIRTSLKRFRDDSGIAAIEFALVLPVLMLMILGSAAIFKYVQAKNVSQRATDTVADLVTRAMEMNDDEFVVVFQAADAIMGPYAEDTTIKGRITGLELVDDGKKWEVTWSKAHNWENMNQGRQFNKNRFPTNHEKDMIVLVETLVIYDGDPFFLDISPAKYRKESVRLPRYASRIDYTDDIEYSGGDDDDADDDDDGNNGHGNDDDGDDDSNPGQGNGRGRNDDD